VVTSYEGKSAVKEIYEDALESTNDKEIMVFRSHLDDEVLGDDFFTEYIERRASREIKTKLIVPFPIIESSLATDKKLLKERRYWPDFKIPAEIAVYADKVSIISFQDRIIGTIIDNKAIADSMRVIFNRVWESLK
jgi:sugar-specific transcriptional regulator TrmB